MTGVMSVGLDGPTASLKYWVGAREAGGTCDFFQYKYKLFTKMIKPRGGHLIISDSLYLTKCRHISVFTRLFFFLFE